MAVTSTLSLGEREVYNVFQLLGDDEDSISKAIAWALARAPTFLSLFLKRLMDFTGACTEVQIRMQRYETGAGITDIELVVPGEAHVIIEAKRGWALPGKAQLSKYARRPSFTGSLAPMKKIITLSECSRPYAMAHCR